MLLRIAAKIEKGVVYFLTHRALWKPLLKKLVPTMTLSVGVVAFMFIFAYLPQCEFIVKA